MSVYKEAEYTIKDLISKQKQIYADACDFGIPIKSEDQPEMKMVNQLKHFYFDENGTRQIHRDSEGNFQGVDLNIQLLHEFGANRGNTYYVTISYWRVSGNSTKTMYGDKIVGILSINLSDNSQNKNS